MNDLTQEWIQKAEGDFIVATSLLSSKIEATMDAICFHCQQCAEKYAKAYLQSLNIEFPFTHNLPQLLSLCREQNDEFSTIALPMQALNSYSVETRYPGRISTLDEAIGAVDSATFVRSFFRAKLHL